MSGTLNKVMLIGHLGDDVKMHYFDGGGCVGRFPLATNEVYTNKISGEKVTKEGSNPKNNNNVLLSQIVKASPVDSISDILDVNSDILYHF